MSAKGRVKCLQEQLLSLLKQLLLETFDERSDPEKPMGFSGLCPRLFRVLPMGFSGLCPRLAATQYNNSADTGIGISLFGIVYPLIAGYNYYNKREFEEIWIMSKIICKCGNILSDSTDNLPYKGYIILFQDSITFFCQRKTKKEIFWIMMAKKKQNVYNELLKV